MTIGERIKKRRIELGLSVDDVAEGLGKGRATVYRYENGEIKKFPATILKPLAIILKTTPTYLLGWDREIDNKEGSKMKNLIENDGTNDVKVQSVTPSKRAWEEHCCAECRYFHRHYVELGDTGAYIPTNDGHCYPPRDYAHIKIQSYKRTACIYFKPTEYET